MFLALQMSMSLSAHSLQLLWRLHLFRPLWLAANAACIYLLVAVLLILPLYLILLVSIIALPDDEGTPPPVFDITLDLALQAIQSASADVISTLHGSRL